MFGTSRCLEQALRVSALAIQALQMSHSLAAGTEPLLSQVCPGASAGDCFSPLHCLAPPTLSEGRRCPGSGEAQALVPRLWGSLPGTNTALGAGCTPRTVPDTQLRGDVPKEPGGVHSRKCLPRGRTEHSHLRGAGKCPAKLCPRWGSAFQKAGRLPKRETRSNQRMSRPFMARHSQDTIHTGQKKRSKG